MKEMDWPVNPPFSTASADQSPVFGRKAEWRWLIDQTTGPPSGRVVYVHGPRGVGKTLLVSLFAKHLDEQGWLVRTVSAGQGVDAVMACLAAMPKRRRRGPEAENLGQSLLRIVDNYDDMPFEYEPLARKWLGQGGGVTIVVGRKPPERLWPGSRWWRTSVSEMELVDFHPCTSRRYLAINGVNDPLWEEEILAFGHGRPGLLELAVDGFHGFAQAGNPENIGAMRSHEIFSLLMEQALHPGSRRLQWRIPVGPSGMDAYLAAASLIGEFDRHLIEAMVGRIVDGESWRKLGECPLVMALEGGRWQLFPSLVDRIEETVKRERPWVEQAWRGRAVGHLVAQVKSGRVALMQVWPALNHLLLPFHPYAGAIGRADRELRFTTIDGSQSTTIMIAYLPDGVECGRLSVAETTAGTAEIALSVKDDLDSLGITLLRRAVPLFAGYGAIRCCRMPSWAWPVLEALGFSREPSSASAVMTLGKDVVPWLEQLSAMVRKPPIDPTTGLRWTFQILKAIECPAERVSRNEPWVQASGFSRPDPFFRWIEDAIDAMALEVRPSLLATILRQYYVEHRGPHERLAEEIHVSRATYFRLHRKAVQGLAERLWQFSNDTVGGRDDAHVVRAGQ